MVRGWRNDPAWIEFYKKRDHERFERERQRLYLELQYDSLKREQEVWEKQKAALQDNKDSTPFAKWWNGKI